MVHELENDNLREIIEKEDTVIVQYLTGGYDQMKPQFSQLAAEYQEAAFIIVDAEKCPKAIQLANIYQLPTFAAFKRGNFVNQVHTNKLDLLKDLVNEITIN
ncbi:MAG: thioredoxin domain-containing protein [Saprospiraceae bacterium]|nr:thioredoxin domain-containing protein [Saprospiraceae bacterium]